jgi:hypothetical protein
MLVTLEVYASTYCAACNVRNFLPGLRGKLHCNNCNAPIVIAPEAAHRLFGGEHDALAMAVVRDDGDLVFDPKDTDRPRIGMFRNVAACICKFTLPTPNEGDTSITCPSCKDVIAVRWPDELTKTYDDRLWCVVGDTNDHEAPLEATNARDAKVVACSVCGAPLTLQEDRRSASCAHCHATNILTDLQRLRLSSKSANHRFFMLYQVDDALLRSVLRHKIEPVEGYETIFPQHAATRDRLLAELEARAKEKRDAKLAESGALEDHDAHALAQREDWTDEQTRHLDSRLTRQQRLQLRSYKVAPKLLALWTTAESPELRAFVAEHLVHTSETLKAFAADVDPGVRAVIAANDQLDPETLHHLSKDSDADVAKAAKQNPKYVPGFFEKLFS